MTITEAAPPGGWRRLLRLARRYWIITLTLLVGIASLVLWLAGAEPAARWTASLYAIAIAVGYTVRMLRTLASGGLGVDLLAVVAIVATVAVGEVAAALVVVLMLSGGAALEDYANRRARHELDALLRRDPRYAHRFAGERLEDVPIGEVAVGDILLVRPSEVVPVDGVLLDAATLDTSSLTGESLPVDRAPGDEVLSGSVNGAEAATLRATAIAADSQYQQIVALVAQAASSRPRVVRLADRYAVPFTVFSLLLGAVAWAVSGEPVRFAEVLVLASPCPLLIAAPVAFLGGMSRAAHSGIVVRSGSVFEVLARARTVVFDKTGTLTTGHPVLREVRPAPGFDATELLSLTASAEQYSSHVLASSVVQAAEQRSVALREVASAEEHATDGVLAQVDSRRVAVGKLAFARSFAPDTPRATLLPGKLAVYVTVDDVYAGVIIEADPPRANAEATVRRLRELGFGDIELLTGDAEETAAHTAAVVGITRYQAECLPADKVRRVAEIAERPVVMVGDGVNDAPVLARADVGVAMGAKGATAASESAAIVLLVDDIGGVVQAVAISRRTIRIALQSIWLGIAACVVLMLIAAFGVIPAIVGALLQEAVDLATILAALRAARAPAASRRPDALTPVARPR